MKTPEEILADIILEVRNPDLPKEELVKGLKEDREVWVEITRKAMKAYAKAKLEEVQKEKEFDINFEGIVMARVRVNNNIPEVVGAIDGGTFSVQATVHEITETPID